MLENLRDSCGELKVALAQSPDSWAMPGGLPMSTLTIRLPDGKQERPKALAPSNSRTRRLPWARR